ncbi:MAG: alpha/beta hydrolase [Bacilli bacterium]
MTLHYHMSFNDADDPTHAVTIVHGAGEHSGRYDYTRAVFAKHGMATVMGDLPGHGHSPGLRGHIDSFDEYVDAADSFLQAAAERYGDGVQHVLLGHSMGGLIAALAAARRNAPPPHALVLSSPCFGLAMKLPRGRRLMGSIMRKITPRLYQPNGINPQDVTRNQEIAAAYGVDRFVHKKVTLSWYFELLRGMDAATRIGGQVRIPVSVWQAGADRLVDKAVSRKWYESVSWKQKSYREYEGYYHEIMNEPERDEVIGDIIKWILETLPPIPRV